MCAQPKVVVKIESEEDMLVLQVSIVYKLFLGYVRIKHSYAAFACYLLNFIFS